MVKWRSSNGERFHICLATSIRSKTVAEYAFIAFPIKNAEVVNKGEKPVTELGVKAVDDLTLEVELEQAVPYFLNLVAFPSYYPLNEKFVKEKGESSV